MPGPNLLTERSGAWIDAGLEGLQPGVVTGLWREHAKKMLHAIGWADEECFSRTFQGGVTLMHTAPFDTLYAATELNEWAFVQAQRALGSPVAENLKQLDLPFDQARDFLAARIEKERKPRLVALRDAALAAGIAFVWDDRCVSLGHGVGSLAFAPESLPDPEHVPWSSLCNVPITLVTGTNGKSTTVRLLAQIAHEAGLVAGLSSTDWVRIGDEIQDRGDYSGPMAARMVLRDRRTQIAILETARGGMLRRGLGVPRADAAVITNVAEDHLGEFGVGDLKGLVDAKFTIARAIQDGRLVLNCDDEQVLARGRTLAKPLLWVALDAQHPTLTRHVAAGGDACFVEGGTIVLVRRKKRHEICSVQDVPITLGGAARYNVSNALCAVGAAAAMELTPKAIAAGLRKFANTPTTNPGRANVFTRNGATIFADFAHNPHGMLAILDMCKRLKPKRWLVILGQAGDRTDEAILDMVRVTWKARPDKVLVKEMQKYLRGRPEGQVVSIIENELLRLGAPPSAIEKFPSEVAAVERALQWAEPGDLVLLLLHEARDQVLELLA